VGGELRYYSVDEAARLLGLLPERVREMAAQGALSSLPPGAAGGSDWKVLLPVAKSPEQSPSSGPAEQADDAPDALGETTEVDLAPAHDETTTRGTDVPAEVSDSPPAVAEAARQCDEEPRGDSAASDREPTSESGWVTTQQAAKALGISARTVRWHIERGNLEAKPEGEGVERTWRVSVDSLQAFRDSRQSTAASPRSIRAPGASADIAASGPGSAIRELADRLVEEARRAEAARVRLELAERAQSTLEAELSAERRRREVAERELEQAQRERAELRLRLEASGTPERGTEPRGAEGGREVAPQSPPSPGPIATPPAEGGARETATAGPQPAEPRSGTPAPQGATRRRSLWRRVFGGG
jgi:Helix-turn-helix domain